MIRFRLESVLCSWCSQELCHVSDHTYKFADEFNRLTSTAISGGGAYTYTYDRWGNRTSQTPGAIASFNGSNQMLGFAYDPAGNLLQDAAGHSYTYDAEGTCSR